MAIPVYLIHYDAPAWVCSAAESILSSDIEVDLTIISNSGSIAVSGATVIDTGSNLGYAGGGNVAIGLWLAGDASVALVGSHDLHLESDAIRRLREAMEEFPDVGIAGANMPDAAAGAVRAGAERAWVSGQALMLRRACIEQIGGFDERFGSYTEDQDLCLRAWDSGWRVMRVETARGHGLGSQIGRWQARRTSWPQVVGLARKHDGLGAGLRANSCPLLANCSFITSSGY